MADRTGYDALILAGGGSRRMGGRDKCAEEVDGRALLDRVIDAAADARQVVVVGPERPTSRPVRWTRERPIGTGPAAALAEGLRVLDPTGVVVVLAGDLPFAADAIPQLLAELDGDGEIDAAIAVDETGREQCLLGAYDASALARALRTIDQAGASMKMVVQRLRVGRVPVPGPATLDCDTPVDLQRAREVVESVSARPAGRKEEP